ncbi:KedN5 family methylcobalamin-dependent radical SAM C-methyltransferase [Crossiella sp. CA-258035]|uniref:KedN5 family methylcobalamin-dependent radical SAM C-methyltransferase n=1 Tax=Crossiella sp. CA-258035 TaxID=2981138 RepID=UPI0024BCDC1D|nr:KedN5 family methylcobalamin-dependent radical SAM C-methyltransferase [Crossiella sp. CA-258035]WHT23334.1 KedN5 family methylcobalamin-dependent radical SAM C-methyltransferase [Crossiella sp. CA-258035]
MIQQGVWDMPLESMPLAAGYMKAMALTDPRTGPHVDIDIVNYRGEVTLAAMANDLLRAGPPDILAFSVFGWNYRAFGSLAETFKQLNPDGWVVFGGTHVANQAERTFRMFPDVDIVVNGEGELTFCDLVAAYLDGGSRHDLGAVEGITYQGLDNVPVTTPARERIQDLDCIPSPFLTGAIPLLDEEGAFRYDVALMETNRGCPYKCSFCYWGGATGQRVRAFSRERLRAELELFAKLKVHTIVLCDANFGMLPIDEEFVDDLLRIREVHGFPRALETSWAKNKSAVFFSIVHKLKQAGMRSSFTLALQTLDDNALRLMNRRNMKVNAWEELAEWLDREGLDSYAELIWGAPGETVQGFMDGYDRLSQHVSRIAVYPLLLLPNTEYAEQKELHGIISVRGDNDDFEYVLAHRTMSFATNQQMQRFLYWSRLLCEMAVFRHLWVGLRELGELRQSQALQDIEQWMSATTSPAAAPLRAAFDAVIGGSDAYGQALSYLFGSYEARRLFAQWWHESMRPKLPEGMRPVLDEIIRFDMLTLPVYPGQDAGETLLLPEVELHGGTYFTRENIPLSYDVPEIIAALRANRAPDLTPKLTIVDLYYRKGFENFASSTNHEEIVHFMGMTREQLDRESNRSARV